MPPTTQKQTITTDLDKYPMIDWGIFMASQNGFITAKITTAIKINTGISLNQRQ